LAAEWSGNLGGVQHGAIRSRVVSWGTVPSLDDWEKEGERAENVESGKLKCATKVAPGGFQVAVGGHRAITLTCIHSLSTKPGQARVRLKLLFPENAAMITNIITILLNYLNLAFTEQPIWSGVF